MDTGLELLVVHVPGTVQTDPAEKARETARIATEVAAEIKKATEKCRSIHQIDAQPASVVGLALTGETSIEKVQITYVAPDGQHTKEYSCTAFYEL